VGGRNSGTWSRDKRPSLEEHRRLDIHHLRRTGLLIPGSSSGYAWYRGDEKSGSVNLRALEGRIIISYRLTPAEGESQDVAQAVSLGYTRCHFGGSRPWFHCPMCGSRVGVLAFTQARFACRRCCRLRYACQSESTLWRAARRLKKVQKRLGNPNYEDVIDPYLPRPKWMRWWTYERIVARAREPSRIIDAAVGTLSR
jgi:hypothetical protein